MVSIEGKIRIEVEEDGRFRANVDMDLFDFCAAHDILFGLTLSSPKHNEEFGTMDEALKKARMELSKQSTAGPAELEHYRRERTKGEGRPERS